MLEHTLDHFAVQIATSPEERDRVHRLRHRVYCEEHGYEPLMPDRREKDLHDEHSVFCVINHRETGRTAGCARLILPGPGKTLAMEEHCREHMYPGDLDDMQRDRHEVCEISRLAVDPLFRKRRAEARVTMRDFSGRQGSEDERRLYSMLGIFTLLTGFVAADLLGRPRTYGMMEACLKRLLHRSGILLHQVGEFMDYHGRRAPFVTSTDVLLEHMHTDLIILFHQIHAELASEVHPQAASSVSKLAAVA